MYELNEYIRKWAITFEQPSVENLETLQKLVTKAIKKIKSNEIEIRDGIAKKGDKVWWRSDKGPKLVYLRDDEYGTHWSNVKNYPDLYQHTQPNVKYHSIEYIE